MISNDSKHSKSWKYTKNQITPSSYRTLRPVIDQGRSTIPSRVQNCGDEVWHQLCAKT